MPRKRCDVLIGQRCQSCIRLGAKLGQEVYFKQKCILLHIFAHFYNLQFMMKRNLDSRAFQKAGNIFLPISYFLLSTKYNSKYYSIHGKAIADIINLDRKSVL